MACVTPETLAEMWGVSSTTVRSLCRRGKLRHFRLGERLIRIPIEAVAEYEQANMTAVSPDAEKPMDTAAALQALRFQQIAQSATARRQPRGR